MGHGDPSRGFTMRHASFVRDLVQFEAAYRRAACVALYGTAARLIAAAAGLGVDEVGEPWRRELEP